MIFNHLFSMHLKCIPRQKRRCYTYFHNYIEPFSITWENVVKLLTLNDKGSYIHFRRGLNQQFLHNRKKPEQTYMKNDPKVSHA